MIEFELASLPKKRDEGRLLHAMGWETANIHLGSEPKPHVLRRDLSKRRAKWLRSAAKAMLEATTRDWMDWRRR